MIQLFKDLGYAYYGNWEERENSSNVEKKYLRAFLQKQGYSETLINKAVLETVNLTHANGGSLYERNKNFYSLLRYGIKTKENVGEQNQTVHLIDWKNPESNNFAIAEEVALLYFDNIHLIIPKSGDKFLSNQLNSILNSKSNPFRKIRPEELEINETSKDATFAIENIIRFPERFSDDFGMTGSETIVDKWKCKDFQLYELFYEKFKPFFGDFCIEKGLVHESDNGIKVSKELANIYMAYLAKSFGDQRNLSPITDKSRIDFTSNKINNSTDVTENIELGFKIIDIYLPQNIDRIPLEEIAMYRNSQDFMKNLHGFHSVIDELYNSIKNQQIIDDTIPLMERFENASQIINNNIKKDLVRTGAELVSISVGCWLAFTSPITIPIGIKLAADSLLSLDATMTVKKHWKSSMQRIHSKRFVTGVKRMTK